MIKIDNTPPGTKRRLKQGAAARRGRRGRTASTTAVGGAKNKEESRQQRLKRERAANMAMVMKDNPMPKSPSADQVKLLNKSRRSAENTEKKLRSMGDELDLVKKTKKQLEKDYGTNTKTPKKAMRGGMMKSKMKAKGYKAGGKTSFPDLNKDGEVTQADILQGRGVVKKKAGGMMKSKGYAKGGAMKTKGYAKGGVAGGKKKQKVRGAGIARRGVRPAKMR